jgi:hypothetical protein
MRYRIHSMILNHEWAEPKGFVILSVLSSHDNCDGSWNITALVGEWVL